jgi:hypothetical protein
VFVAGDEGVARVGKSNGVPLGREGSEALRSPDSGFETSGGNIPSLRVVVVVAAVAAVAVVPIPTAVLSVELAVVALNLCVILVDEFRGVLSLNILREDGREMGKRRICNPRGCSRRVW